MTKTKAKGILNTLSKKINPHILVVAILVVIIIIILSGRRSFDATYDAYVKATIECDAEAIVDLLHDSYIDKLIADEKIDSEYELIQRVQNKLDWYAKNAEKKGYETYNYTLELLSVYDGILENEQNMYYYGLEELYGENISNIKDAKVTTIQYIVYNTKFGTGMNKNEQIYNPEEVYFIKIGHKWYLGQIARHEQFVWD